MTTVPIIGRPKKFDSVEELQTMINEYFASCFEEAEIEWDEENNVLKTELKNTKPLTITGLALALGTTRRTLLDYETDPKLSEFSHTIKEAKQVIENYAAEQLFSNPRTVGIIFSMKNNHGWIDKQEIDQTNTQKGAITIEQLPADNDIRKFMEEERKKRLKDGSETTKGS